MSNVSVIYDTLTCKIGELFPVSTRIPNAYSLEDNNKRLMENGYGIRIGSADFQEFEFCNFVVNRTITVVFTRELFRLDSQTDQTDEIVKELMENVYQTQKLLYSYNELGIEESILKVDIGSVSGIETFLKDKQNFLSMTCDFQIQIKESL